MDEKCETCYYCYNPGEGYKTCCHRYPLKGGSGIDWPEVGKEDYYWCGEWKEKPNL